MTEAERERLTMLAEEASEIVQAATKALRHGYNSHDPTGQKLGSNKDQLFREIEDLKAVLFIMINADDFAGVPRQNIEILAQRKLRYTHHQ